MSRSRKDPKEGKSELARGGKKPPPVLLPRACPKQPPLSEGCGPPNFPLSSDVPKREELPSTPAPAGQPGCAAVPAGSGTACPPRRWPPRCCAPCSPACCRWPAGACCRRSAAWGAGCAPGRAARPCSPACSASSTCARRRTTEAGRPRAGTGRAGPGGARRLLPPARPAAGGGTGQGRGRAPAGAEGPPRQPRPDGCPRLAAPAMVAGPPLVPLSPVAGPPRR